MFLHTVEKPLHCEICKAKLNQNLMIIYHLKLNLRNFEYYS